MKCFLCGATSIGFKIKQFPLKFDLYREPIVTPADSPYSSGIFLQCHVTPTSC
jgi:hypothetical protein